MCEACNKNVIPLHAANQRVKLKDINPSLHCSIIGTCLSMRELRKTARKIAAQFDVGVSDYDVHSSFVNMINKHDLTAKLLHKMLDRKFAGCIRMVRSLGSEDELLDYWREALKTGDIPGPYWAVMSHPMATEVIRARLFGDVHMLSHLVGAANRADIKRLQDLEAENEALHESQQEEKKRYHEEIVGRDQEITKLRDEIIRGKLARSKFEATERRLEQYEDGSIVESMSAQITSLQTALEKQTLSHSQIVAKQKLDRSELVSLQELNAGLVEEVNEALQERRSLERVLERGLGEMCKSCGLSDKTVGHPSLDLGGVTILYVGGRTSHVHHMKTLVEQAGGVFVHHDGGIEDNDHRLTQLLSRGDIVMCPMDCVSHTASLRAKKFCRHQGKNFVPLRSSGLSSFVAGLEEVS